MNALEGSKLAVAWGGDPNDAVFRVVKVDPEGSGLDWSGHLGSLVDHAARCCRRCTIVFGKIGGHEIGPFVRGELEPVNLAAQKIWNEIEAYSEATERRHG